jgi:hypothetical protein
MSNNVIQSSFNAGELSPNLYAHVDLAKYHSGVALARNFFVDYRGGLTTRPGFAFCAQCQISNKPVRLIPFQFSVIQTYMLEFGDGYMRVFIEGAPVLEAALTILGITQANPGVVNVTAHGYVTNDEVYLLVAGMTQLNQVTAKVNVIDANHFSLVDLFGAAIDTTSYSAFTSGTVGRVYSLATPFLAEDLFDFKYVQNADTMVFTHKDYVPRSLTRTGHTSWILAAITTGSTQAAPGILTGSQSAGGTTDYRYVVTAVSASGDESVASPDLHWGSAVDIATTAGWIGISWAAVTGAAYYNVYKAQPVVGGTVPVGVNFGFIGDTTGTTFIDTNVVPDFVTTPPLHTDPFSGNSPSTVAYFQQRRVFAASINFPETLWMSQPGSFTNFDVTNPVADDNAITATLISNQVNNIKHMIAMPGGLICLTGGGAWQVSGGGNDAPITPRSITATPQAYNGCSDVPPIVINYDILYNQARGSVVRDLAYSFYTNIYTGTDISVLANHLLTGRVVTSWAYAEDPFKVVWSTTSDGELLSLTYLKEQEVYGWAHSDTAGLFKCVSQVPEGTTSAVYAIVERTIQGQTLKYVERMVERRFPYGSEDAFCVDAGLRNTLTYPSATIRASAASGTGVLFSASAGVFALGDVGKILRMGGGIATITGFNNASQLVGTLTRPITGVVPNTNPVEVAPVEEGDWSLVSQFTTFGGLQHLTGQTVKLLGDGNVFPDQTVSASGTVTFSQPVSKACVGLGFTAQMQTLYLDVGDPTIQGKRKKIAALTTRVTETRGLKMGSDFDHLTEFKMRNSQPMGQPIELETGDQRIVMDPTWNVYGQICIQQDYPLPASVLGVIPEIVVGDTK